jgi:hypothetical protein
MSSGSYMNDYTEEDLQKVIDESFEGSRKAYFEAAAKSKRETLKWQDIVATNTVLPDLAEDGLKLIEYYLGYVPDDYDTFPQQAFIRAVVNQYLNGAINIDALFDLSKVHIQQIRNDTMKDHLEEGFSFATYQKYETYFAHYRTAVTDRLTKFLGYEPNLEHSLKVELMLRENMADDTCHFPDDDMTALDIQAISIIKYRELLFSDGKSAADASPFIIDQLLK